MSPVGPTAPDPGDPLVPWAPVRATAVDGVVVQPVPGDLADSPGAWVAWPAAGEVVVLDGFTHAVWRQLDGSSSVADLADELADAGLPAELDPTGLVATAVHDLVATGLATSGPDPLPSLPAARRRIGAPADAGGAHRISHLATLGAAESATATEDSEATARSDGKRAVDGAAAPHHLHLAVDGRVVVLAVPGPSVADRLGGRGRSAAPPGAGSADVPLVELTPTLPSGFTIAVDGRVVDWADEEDAPDRTAAALTAAVHVQPPGAVVDLGPGWAATDQGAGSGPSAVESAVTHGWHPRRWLDARGDLLVPAAGAHRRWVAEGATRPDDWRAEPVTALSVPRVGGDRAEVLADLASLSRGADRLGALDVLATVADRVDTGPSPHDRGDPSLALDHLRAAQPWLDHLLALGTVGARCRSVKLGAGRLVTDRWLVWLTPRADLDEARIRSALGAAGLPDDHAGPLVQAIAEGRQLVVGSDGDGPRAGRKLYVEDPPRDWWQRVRTHLPGSPAVDPPADDRHAASPDDEVLPVFVAWKWWPGAPRAATYWPAPGHDPRGVLPDHPEWAEALDAFPLHRGPGPHLLLTESTGRRSLDLLLTEPTWGAALDPQLRRLAAVAGLDARDRDRLLAAVHTEKVARVIGGLDHEGRPLAGLYLETHTLPETAADARTTGRRGP